MSTKVLSYYQNNNKEGCTEEKKSSQIDKIICNTTDDLSYPLDTLGQLRTKSSNLVTKARKKFFTNGLAVGLVSASECNTESKLTKSYWRSYHCCNQLELLENGTIKSQYYCDYRWCMTCNAIRTAKHIIAYREIIDSWEEPYFITLTQKTVPSCSLTKMLDEMQRIFCLIKDSYYKDYKRGKLKEPLTGVRKLECTYRPITDHYHPHYHIVVKNKSMGEYILSRWIELNDNAEIHGQKLIKANGNTLLELFKYMTKIIASTGKRPNTNDEKLINAKALDIVFNALHGRRTIQNFGFKINKNCMEDNGDNVKLIALDVLQWNKQYDWVNVRTGELFTNYVPSEAFKKMIDSIL